MISILCFSLIVFIVLFFLTLFYFTILYWFCHTLTWIHHRCTCVPKHEPPSHLPPHNISLGHHRAPAPSMLYRASDIDWRFDSYMIVYMLQCHSPKSSHPLPLPLSPKVHYTHLCLFPCLANRAVIAIFSWAISNAKRWCCESAALNMPTNLENSAVATGLEKVSFHSSPKERPCHRMLKLPHNCTHLTC